MSEFPEFIGRFPIIDTLGVGGMGVVYSAKDPDIGRLVAIKVLHSNGDESALERFKNEARTIGEISHPNIVMLLEYGIDNKKPFLVMEHLAGESLEQWIDQAHKLSEHKSILIDLCHALQFAHDKHILHRDLKPGNIQILPTGQAKLLDFGIARSQDTGLTASGFFIGTPKYLAPEILQNTIHTQSSDCYSLGLLAYTMLSGNNPFSAATFEAAMTKQLTLKPALLHELNPKIPEKLSQVIDKYLEKNPDNRPSTPDLLKNTLQQLTAPAQLNKKIIPNKNPDPSNSDAATLIFTEKTNKSKKRLMATTTLLLFTAIAVFTYTNTIKTAGEISENQQPVIKPIVTKPIDKSANKQLQISLDDTPPIEPQKESIKKGENQKSATNEDITLTDNSIQEIVEPENNESVKPKVTTIQTKKPATKIVQTKQEEKQPDSTDEITRNDKTTDKPTILTPPLNDHTITDSSTDNNTIKNRGKNKIETPVFTLPKFNHKSKKIKIHALSNTEVSRGKTKKIKIEIPDGIKLDEFKIFRGRSEFNQVKVRNIQILDNKHIQLMIYAEPNTTLGDCSLFAIYHGKKSIPIILEVTL
ncbi:MAG: serine/threonine protein kinase [Alcanivoracaceae bacterium]|nr:serine/threonine protein kinase [Alcanivoracaceae bacterium]